MVAAQVFVKYYSEPSALKLAVENGEVDVAWRSMSAPDIADLEGNGDVTVAKGQGAEIRYWVWKVDSPVGKDAAVRQAAAQVFDRESIAENAYDGTVDPLYSIVPPGFAGQKDSFEETYGAPDPAKAQADPRRRRHPDAGGSSPSAGRLLTTARAPRTRPTRSSASSRRAGCSTSP